MADSENEKETREFIEYLRRSSTMGEIPTTSST